MISREQAERASDALLASAQAEQEKAAERNTRFLVHLFPSLEHVAPLERQSAVNEARGFASNHLSSRLLLALVTLACGVYIAMNLTGHADDAVAVGWFTACTFIGRQLFEQILMRRHIRGRTRRQQ